MNVQNQPWSKVPRVLSITGDPPDICAMWRNYWPSIELAGRGYISDYCTYGELHTFSPAIQHGRYNIVSTTRMGFEEIEAEEQWFTFIDSLRPAVKFIYDCDDDLWTPTIVDRLLRSNLWLERDRAYAQLESMRQSRLRIIQRVDAITVSSDLLVDLATELSSAPVTKVPNGIHSDLYTFTLNSTPERTIPPLTIGWSGGPRLVSDLEPLYDVWPRIAALRPDVQFVLQGWTSPKMVALMPANRLRCIAGLPTDAYPAFLKNIDIFCCVAHNDPLCASKTPIKFFESTLAGAACVVSPTLYGPVVTPGVDALLADTAEDWIVALLSLIDNPDLRTRLNTAARQTVMSTHTLKQTYSQWLEAWSSIL